MNSYFRTLARILCCLIIISLADNAYAETIISHERHAGRSIQMQNKNIQSSSKKYNDVELPKNENKVGESRQKTEHGDKKLSNENKNDNNLVKVQIGKVTKDFYAERPKYNKTFQDKYSSLNCQYVLKTGISNEEFTSICIAFQKTRWAGGLLNSDTHCILTISTYNLMPEPLFSKKYEPFIEKEYKQDVNKFVFKNPSTITSSFVCYNSLSIKQMEKLFEKNSNITYTLVFYNENKDMIKIPLSNEAIEMFNNVVLTDLKKMKKEYDKK